MHFLRLLRQRHLALLWGGQVASAIGDYLYEIAVVWIAVQVAGGGAGLVVGAGTVSRFVCGLLGGVYADRWDRRRLLIGADLLRAAIVAVPLFLATAGRLELWHLALVAILVGGLGSFFDPALQASLPALARDDDLYALNGLMDGTRRLARALGPSAAGVLVAVLPLPQFFTLNLISYLVSAATILAIGRGFAWRAATEPHHRAGGLRGVAREIGVAIALVRGHRALAYGIGANATSNLGWSAAFTVGAPLLADRVLSGGVGAYGAIVGAYGVGNIIANFAIGSLRITRPLLTLNLGRVILGAGFLIVALAPSVPVAVVGAAIAAVGGPMGDVVLLTMMQRDLPTGQLGKVYALRLTTATVGMSLGLLLAGPLYLLVPVPLGIAICAALIVATGLFGLVRFPDQQPHARDSAPLLAADPAPREGD